MFLRFKDFGFAKRCNKAEYASITGAFIERIEEVGADSLHIPDELFRLYKEKHHILLSIIGISRISDETGRIALLSSQLIMMLKYILSVIRSARTLVDKKKSSAAICLYNLTKNHTKTRRLPQMQKLATINSLLGEFSKPELAVHIKTLGLDDEVEQLMQLNADYESLIESRSDTQIINHQYTSKAIRKEMDELYDAITSIVWSFSIIEPSEMYTRFIKTINKILSDAQRAYNQRRAQSSTNLNNDDATEEAHD